MKAKELELERKMEKAMASFDCAECIFRTDKGLVSSQTNWGIPCLIGFKQNPRTVEASRNLIANGGILCCRHPLKHLL